MVGISEGSVNENEVFHADIIIDVIKGVYAYS